MIKGIDDDLVTESNYGEKKNMKLVIIFGQLNIPYKEINGRFICSKKEGKNSVIFIQ